MNANHQTVPINSSNQIVIQLPEHVDAVEAQVTWQLVPTIEARRAQLIQRVEAWNVANWPEEQRVAQQRLIEFLATKWNPDGKREMGLLAPFMTIANDFDAPLPKEVEDSFWGSLTDDYGLSLKNNEAAN